MPSQLKSEDELMIDAFRTISLMEGVKQRAEDTRAKVFSNLKSK